MAVPAATARKAPRNRPGSTKAMKAEIGTMFTTAGQPRPNRTNAEREPGERAPRGHRGPRRAVAVEPRQRRTGEPQGDERRAHDLDRREHLGDRQDQQEAVPRQLVADVELEQGEPAQHGEVAQPELADDRPAHVAHATEPAVGRPERGAQHPVT